MAQQDRTPEYLWLMANHMAQFLPKNPDEAERVIAILERRASERRGEEKR